MLADQTFNPHDFSDPLPCLWSKGLSRCCDFRGPEDYWLAPTESVQDEQMFREHYKNAFGLVWVRLSTQARDGRVADLDHFVAAALPTIHKPFVLITSDGDVSVPSELRAPTVQALLASPWLRAWYTQNYDGTGGHKLAPLPIGLDLHTPRPFSSPAKLIQDLDRIETMRKRPADLPLKVFCDIGLSLASLERVKVFHGLVGCKHVDMLQRRVSQRAIWALYARYPFVLSLKGNGLDCHRTWEALYLGSIVITLTSPLDALYVDLPVVILKDWKEILDEKNLQRWLIQYGPLTAKDHVRNLLQAETYMKRIRQKNLSAEPETRTL